MNAPTAKPLDLSQFDGHTPGHWENDFQALGVCVVGSIAGAGRQVCECYEDGQEQTAEDMRNSVLIAAAPALLAECKAQRERINSLEAALVLAAGTFTNIYLESAPARKNALAQKLGKWANQGNTDARAILANAART